MRVWPAVLVDLLAIVIFALVGRASHAEAADLLGLGKTAWPFLAGWLVGGLVSRIWLRPAALRTGVIIWVSTVVIGMLLRFATHAGVQLSFVIVASIVLGIFLIGWRAGYRLIRARTHPAED